MYVAVYNSGVWKVIAAVVYSTARHLPAVVKNGFPYSLRPERLGFTDPNILVNIRFICLYVDTAVPRVVTHREEYQQQQRSEYDSQTNKKTPQAIFLLFRLKHAPADYSKELYNQAQTGFLVFLQ
jgi:hypothetical protein